MQHQPATKLYILISGLLLFTHVFHDTESICANVGIFYNNWSKFHQGMQCSTRTDLENEKGVLSSSLILSWNANSFDRLHGWKTGGQLNVSRGWMLTSHIRHHLWKTPHIAADANEQQQPAAHGGQFAGLAEAVSKTSRIWIIYFTRLVTLVETCQDLVALIDMACSYGKMQSAWK